jgi:hypothetical protein
LEALPPRVVATQKALDRFGRLESFSLLLPRETILLRAGYR